MIWLLLMGCTEPSVVTSRLPALCAETLPACGVSAGCVLDPERYVTGQFPGARRVLLDADEPTAYRVWLRFTEMGSAGSELLLQLHSADCTVDPYAGRIHWVDVDLFERAGTDWTLILDGLEVDSEGEHLLEVYSDATAAWQLVVTPYEPEED